MADLPVSNAEMVAEMVIGADVTETVTPANPSPPTNITSVGETPPNTITVPVEAPDDHDDWGSPVSFAANAGGEPHEGFNQTSTDNWTPGNVVTVSNDLFPWTTTPNTDHPSSPDYVEDTTFALSERGVDTSGEDAVYADEEFEDEEEDATEAAKTAQESEAPRRGRPPGSKNKEPNKSSQRTPGFLRRK